MCLVEVKKEIVNWKHEETVSLAVKRKKEVVWKRQGEKEEAVSQARRKEGNTVGEKVAVVIS